MEKKNKSLRQYVRYCFDTFDGIIEKAVLVCGDRKETIAENATTWNEIYKALSDKMKECGRAEVTNAELFVHIDRTKTLKVYAV